MSNQSGQDVVVEATRQWLEKAVIGLNLCPFAGQPWRQGRVRLRVSDATDLQQLAQHLGDELLALQEADPANCTNRSPYPMLHLLREASIEAATASLPASEAIYERNIKTMRDIGLAGWKS